MAHESKTSTDYKVAIPRGMSGAEYLDSPEYLIHSITPALQEKIDKIKKLVEKDRRNTILARYDLGLLVKEVYDDAENQGGTCRYGIKAMEKLCLSVPWSRSLLYEALQFVQTMCREEAERLSGLQTQSGQPIFWTHVRLLAGVTDSKKRDDLLQRTIQENWSCDELGKTITQLKEPHDPTATPKVQGPRNFNGMIDQQRAAADKFLERAETVWNDPDQSLTTLCLDLSPAKYTEQGANKLKALAVRLRLVAQEAERRAQEADKVFKDYLNTLVSVKIQAAELEDAPEEEVETEEDLEGEEARDMQLAA